MRYLLLAVITLVLAACAQTGQPRAKASGQASASGTPAAAPQDASRYFGPELSAVQEAFAAGLTEACVTHAEFRSDFDSCLRTHIVEAFDDSGLGRRNCARKTELTEFGECVVIGNEAIDVLQRLGAKAENPAGLWSGPDAASNVVRKALAAGASDQCGKSTSASAARGCVDRWLTTRLAIPEALERKCPAKAGAPERNGCLIEASTIRFRQEHLPRLNAIST